MDKNIEEKIQEKNEKNAIALLDKPALRERITD